MPETDDFRGAAGSALAEIDFEPDGGLSESSLNALRGSNAVELGWALTTLIERLAMFDVARRRIAQARLEGAIRAASIHGARIDVAAEVPRLVRLYRSVAVDTDRQDVAAIVLALLATAERPIVMARIPLDSEGLELRVRLGRALDDAIGIVPAESGSTGTRGFDIDEEAVGAEPEPVGAAPEFEPEPEPVGAAPEPDPEPEPVGAAPEFEPEPEPESVGAEPAVASEPPDFGPPPAAAPGPPPVDAADETYKAYGVLDCDELVLVGRPFPLEVGLGERPSPGVSGPAMRPPVPVEPYDLDVQLFADGFDVAPGESLRQTLRISNDDRFPTVVLHLTARAMPEHLADREISAAFVIAGEPLGTAQRYVRVTTDVDEIADRILPVGGATGANITAPTGEPKAHLTIIIKRGLAPGSLMWSVESDLPGVHPPGPIPDTDIGDQPVKFAKNLIGQIKQREHDNSIFSLVEGLGGVIAEEMPTEVVDAIRAAADVVKPDRLQILILTDEPFVPWELAWLDPPLDPELPAYLGAQANVGRWILNAKTPTDPRRAVKAGAMAVVSGVFTDMTRLEAAEEEARQLGLRYQARQVDATLDPVMTLLRGTPAVDIIHFAVHGKYDPQGYDEGIYLVKGPPILPLQVRTGKLKDRAPFVFLNACQLGSSAELLGNYYGTAEAFLRAGASAVVAPLWSVDDEIAQQIALQFYERALAAPADADGEAPLVADLLREVRLGIVANADKQSATYLAYQFYGHPSLRLSWAPTN